MAIEVIRIPDLGGVNDVEVIQVEVAVGDEVAAEDILLVLESDKASMEIPSPYAGKLLTLDLKEGDRVAVGDQFATLELGAAQANGLVEHSVQSSTADRPSMPSPPAEAAERQIIEVRVPDLGGAEEVEVIELAVKPGDELVEGDTYVVLESDKASMEVPCPTTGKVVELAIAVGEVVREGALALTLETLVTEPKAVATTGTPAVVTAPVLLGSEQPATAPTSLSAADAALEAGPPVHAGPAVRKIARAFGVQLDQVTGTGPKQRILKEDVQAFVKERLQGEAPGGRVVGTGVPSLPTIDFSQFGPVRVEPMSKLQKITAANMHRSWLNVPRVTQFDDADITELEQFRAELKPQAKERGFNVTPMPFLLKACALALVNNPVFNASLHADGEQIVYKDYVHIGMAVATPAGLMVPVLRDVDKKSIFQLAAESVELAQKAKDRALKPQEMQGGCFTISSLGNIGGTGFTPVVNAPEVAILGVSKLMIKPVWDGTQFLPRQMLPLALAYDHRAVNGADAGKFMTELVAGLSDIRRLLL